MRMLNNIYFCIIFPMLVSGLITVGLYYLTLQLSPFYPTEFILLMSGSAGYLVGQLVGGNYKWIKQ